VNCVCSFYFFVISFILVVGVGGPRDGVRIARIQQFNLKLMQFVSFKILSFNSQLVQFNQRSAALGRCVRMSAVVLP